MQTHDRKSVCVRVCVWGVVLFCFFSTEKDHSEGEDGNEISQNRLEELGDFKFKPVLSCQLLGFDISFFNIRIL